MPDKQFLEDHQVYKKFKKWVGRDLQAQKSPPIRVPCKVCGSEQTFTIREYRGHAGATTADAGYAVALYSCAGCNGAHKVFLLELGKVRIVEVAGPDGKKQGARAQMAPWVMKAGESPRWEPRVKVSLERALAVRGERAL